MRQIRSRDRMFRVLVGLPDRHSERLAASMAVATSTASPMARGGDYWENCGLSGLGVNESSQLLPPLQTFRGATSPVANPQTASRDLLANSAPSTKDGRSIPTEAWLDLGKRATVRWG